MNIILLILKSMACSPLLVKYHAIETTAITTIKTSMFKSTTVLMKQRHKGKPLFNMACLLATSQHHIVYHITTPHRLPHHSTTLFTTSQHHIVYQSVVQCRGLT